MQLGLPSKGKNTFNRSNVSGFGKIKYLWCLLFEASDWPQTPTPARKTLEKSHLQVSGWPLEGTSPLRIELRVDQFPEATTHSLIEAANQFYIFDVVFFSFNLHLLIYFFFTFLPGHSLSQSFVAFLPESSSRPVLQAVVAAATAAARKPK